jgi:hypothetical protein
MVSVDFRFLYIRLLRSYSSGLVVVVLMGIMKKSILVQFYCNFSEISVKFQSPILSRTEISLPYMCVPPPQPPAPIIDNKYMTRNLLVRRLKIKPKPNTHTFQHTFILNRDLLIVVFVFFGRRL